MPLIKITVDTIWNIGETGDIYCSILAPSYGDKTNTKSLSGLQDVSRPGTYIGTIILRPDKYNTAMKWTKLWKQNEMLSPLGEDEWLFTVLGIRVKKVI